MFRIIHFAFSIGVVLMATESCIQPQQKKQEKTVADEVKLITNGTAMIPALIEIDSVAILYYTDPFGGEAERYTRFYTQYDTPADTLIDLLKQNLMEPFMKDTLRNCRSEGKIFCFVKKKPVQTIYFTNQNANCHHLYFIYEGRYYYFRPNKAFEDRLRELKLNARKM